MRFFFPILAASASLTGLIVSSGCGSSNNGSGAGAGTSTHATSTHATTSTTSGATTATGSTSSGTTTATGSTSSGTTTSTGSTSSGTTTSTGSSTSGTTTSTGSASTSSGAGGSGTGGGGNGGAPTAPFECTVPAMPPSKGSCVTTVAANDAGTGIECNPVTNAGCAAGDACDVNFDQSTNTLIGFVCYTGPFTDTLCATCDNTTAATSCPATQTCFAVDQAGDAKCAQYCCSDADCGTGKCTTMSTFGGMTNPDFTPLAPNLGICTTM